MKFFRAYSNVASQHLYFKEIRNCCKLIGIYGLSLKDFKHGIVGE
ncbi:hypothetical protein SAMN05444266_103103 [Chitinophaga jiangningensis]|uniref:Uncharacterized protein n=1 Tax=Chitinophaga jiangningensis TaxID=1419482 RepID=A0A1M7A3F1_9BACT|nr:hypothetical protein SAMN05444266_103103 [Chitinophaga jiangningensis]